MLEIGDYDFGQPLQEQIGRSGRRKRHARERALDVLFLSRLRQSGGDPRGVLGIRMPYLSGMPHEHLHFEVLDDSFVPIALGPQHGVGRSVHDERLEQPAVTLGGEVLDPEQMPDRFLERETVPVDLGKVCAHDLFFPSLDAVLNGVQKRCLVTESGVECAYGGARAADYLSGGESLEALALDERLRGSQKAFLGVAAPLLAGSFHGMCGFGHGSILTPPNLELETLDCGI